MGWLRNYIRGRTKQIPRERAMKMKTLLSIIYAFSAWNAFSLGIYYIFKHSYPKNEEDQKYPSKYYAKLIASGDAKVMRFSGFTLTNEYDIKGIERPEVGKTWEQHAKEESEREEREREERERKNRQDLNLLVEETSSL